MSRDPPPEAFVGSLVISDPCSTGEAGISARICPRSERGCSRPPRADSDVSFKPVAGWLLRLAGCGSRRRSGEFSPDDCAGDCKIDHTVGIGQRFG